MNSKQEKYRQLCTSVPLPIYAMDWWMDALVGASNWAAAIVEDEKVGITAALPYYHQNRLGLTIIKHPPLATYTHLYLNYPDSPKSHRRYSFERKQIKAIAEQLPANLLTNILLDPSTTNGLPFHWLGFQQLVRYTYRWESVKNPAALFREMESSVRGHIRKARQQLRVQIITEIDPFYELVQKNFKHKKMANPIPLDSLKNLNTEIQLHNAGHIFVAKDQSEAIHAAAYCIHDHQYAYYWLSASDPMLRSSGATYFLLWEILKHYAKTDVGFDLEGSMLPDIEPVFTSLGAQQVPYFQLIKFKMPLIKSLYYLFYG